MATRVYQRPWFVTSMVFLAVLACFWPARHFDFINFDDNIYVSENWFVHAGFSRAGLTAAFSDLSTGHWHPLTWLSHTFDFSLFGADPGGHHLTNILLHALNAMLLLYILQLATGNLGCALLAALIFGVHPMRIESVAWVSERKDVLSMFFGLMSVLAYVYYARERHPRMLWAICCLLSFTLSLMAKPTFVTLPILLLILDYWPLQRLNKRSVLEKIPLLILSIMSSVVVVYAQIVGQGFRSAAEVSVQSRLANAFVSYLAYLGKFVWPTGMAIFYPFVDYAPGIGAGCVFGLIGVTALICSQRRNHPYLIAGWLWFMVALLPMAGFVSIGGQTFADRWTYLPHIGLIAASVWFGADILARSHRLLQLPTSIALVALCLTITRLNLPYWQNSESLWQHTLDVSPNNFMAHTNLGTALDLSGHLDQAAPHFEEAARLNPGYPEALNNLGSLRARQQKLSEAQELFKQALSINPGFVPARYHLGLTYSNLGNQLAAAMEWVTVLKQVPTHSASAQSLNYLLVNHLLGECSSPAAQDLHTSLVQWNPTGPQVDMKSQMIAALGCP